MFEYNIKLVDNKDFIRWAASTPNSELGFETAFDPDMLKLNEFEKSRFYTADGARYITTIAQLEDALLAMFWHRVDWWLEIMAVMDLLPYPDISSCSEATQTIGWSI